MTNTHPSLFRTLMQTPIGQLTLVANDHAIVAIRWDEERPDAHNPVGRTLGDEFVDVLAGVGEHAVLDLAVEPEAVAVTCAVDADRMRAHRHRAARPRHHVGRERRVSVAPGPAHHPDMDQSVGRRVPSHHLCR